jgi:hypothetical protein
MIPPASNIAAARRSWERVTKIEDPDAQCTMRAIWATCWATVLLDAASTNSTAQQGTAELGQERQAWQGQARTARTDVVRRGRERQAWKGRNLKWQTIAI